MFVTGNNDSSNNYVNTSEFRPKPHGLLIIDDVRILVGGGRGRGTMNVMMSFPRKVSTIHTNDGIFIDGDFVIFITAITPIWVIF